MKTNAARAIFWAIFAIGEIGAGYFLYQSVCKSNYLPCWSIALGMLLVVPIIVVVESVGHFFCCLMCQKQSQKEKESTDPDPDPDSDPESDFKSECKEKFESIKSYSNPTVSKSLKICSRQATTGSLPTYSEACVLLSSGLKQEANYV